MRLAKCMQKQMLNTYHVHEVYHVREKANKSWINLEGIPSNGDYGTLNRAERTSESREKLVLLRYFLG